MREEGASRENLPGEIPWQMWKITFKVLQMLKGKNETLKSECIVQEEGNNAVKEPAESVEVGPITAAAEECSDSEEGLIEFYTLTACKTPLFKRKQGSETCGSA